MANTLLKFRQLICGEEGIVYINPAYVSSITVGKDRVGDDPEDPDGWSTVAYVTMSNGTWHPLLDDVKEVAIKVAQFVVDGTKEETDDGQV